MSSQHRCTVCSLSKYLAYFFGDFSLKKVIHSLYVKIYKINLNFY